VCAVADSAESASDGSATRSAVVKYDLSHLTQPDDQLVAGPIQDDEALLLFAVIRVMRLRRVLEIGGLDGYSARNFCEAVGPEGSVYTIDQNYLPAIAPNHATVKRDVAKINAADVGNAPLDLIFFDCHDYAAQMGLYHRFCDTGMITSRTVIALHDTNLHPPVPGKVTIDGGWAHQPVERRMVNDLHRLGWDAFVLDTRMKDHDIDLPVRHGLTLMRQFVPLAETDRLIFRLRTRLARSIQNLCLSAAPRIRARQTSSDRQ
jgi:predicted O-methyltransferase YrrM